MGGSAAPSRPSRESGSRRSAGPCTTSIPTIQARGGYEISAVEKAIVASPHRCDGCTRLYYPESGPDAGPLRDDAIIVGLGPREIERAKRLGTHRAGTHRKSKLRDRFEPEDRTENDIQAAGAELAVARILGLELQPERAPTDVGRYGVRFSRLDCMPIRSHERATPDLIEIFVTGALPAYTLRGWIRVEEAWARRDWIRSDPPPYACVPMADLHDLRRIPEIRARMAR